MMSDEPLVDRTDRRTYHRYRNLECANPFHDLCFGVDDMTYDAIAKHVAGRRGGTGPHPVDCTCWMHAILREGVRRGEWLDRDGDECDAAREQRLIPDLVQLRKALHNYDHIERFGHQYANMLVALYRIGRDLALTILRDLGSETASEEWAASEIGKTAAYDHVVLEAVTKLCPELSYVVLQDIWLARPFYAKYRLRDSDVALPFEPSGEDATFSVVHIRWSVWQLLDQAIRVRAEKMV